MDPYIAFTFYLLLSEVSKNNNPFIYDRFLDEAPFWLEYFTAQDRYDLVAVVGRFTTAVYWHTHRPSSASYNYLIKTVEHTQAYITVTS